MALIHREGGFLLARRPPGKSYGDKWEFPGGKVEVGETLEQAVVREIREELAISICVEQIHPEYEFENDTGSLISFVPISCSWMNGEIELAEHSEWILVEGHAIEVMDLAPPDYEALQYLDQYPAENRISKQL